MLIMRPLILVSILFATLILNQEVKGQSLTDPQWQAGVSSIDITPSMPMWMAGYGSRNKPGNEVAHPLHAKALALKDGTGKVALIITLDILGVPANLRKMVEKQVSENYGISPSYLLMSYSHTHSGPEVRSIETALFKRDPARTELVNKYRAELEEKILKVAGEAFSRMVPAKLSYGKAKAGFAMNRRIDYSLPENDPGYGKAITSNGPVDHDVPVLRVTDANDKLMAIIFSYACHATTLGNYTFHGDYPGFAQHYLEESHEGATALFIAGCGADQNPHPRGDMVSGLNGLDLAKMHGRTLALAVEAALNSHPRTVEPRLESILETASLEYLTVPSYDELNKRTEAKDAATRENAQVLLEKLERDGKLPRSYSYPVQVMRFGKDLTLVALASEVVVDYSLRLKRELPGDVWVAAYSNDFLGYIPSFRIWKEGGYEGGNSLTFTSTTLYRGAAHPDIWAPTVEKNIISKVNEINGKINDKLNTIK